MATPKDVSCRNCFTKFVYLLWIFCDHKIFFLPFSFGYSPTYSILGSHMAYPFHKPSFSLLPKHTQISLCHNLKLANQFKGCILPPLLNAIVINHILPCLPRTPLMLWHLLWMNKMWFRVINKNLPWNALKIVTLDHKCYFNYITKHGMKRQSLQACFELEFLCTIECLAATNIYLDCDLDTNSKEDLKSSVQTLDRMEWK